MSTDYDWIAALLVIFLLATLIAFFTGLFPYPFGWIILAGMLVYRLTGREKK